MTSRAKSGGEIGQNGEFYDGGQFLPSTDLPKGAKAKRAVMALVCYERTNTAQPGDYTPGYTYVDVTGDSVSILDAVGYRATQYVGDIMRLIDKHAENAAAAALVEAFNAGARWTTREQQTAVRNWGR